MKYHAHDRTGELFFILKERQCHSRSFPITVQFAGKYSFQQQC